MKSCKNCRWVINPDTTWECGHTSVDSWFYTEPSADIMSDDFKFAQYCAADCPGYQFFDWVAARQQDALAEAAIEQKLPTEIELRSWRELDGRDWQP